MNKLREKYALHNKYRMSSSSHRQESGDDSLVHDTTTRGQRRDPRNHGSTLLPEKSSIPTSVDNDKANIQESFKTYASSSATLSTASASASASFDSGETKSSTADASGNIRGALRHRNRTGSSRPKTSDRNDHRAYEPIGKSRARSGQDSSHGVKNGYLSLDHSCRRHRQQEDVSLIDNKLKSLNISDSCEDKSQDMTIMKLPPYDRQEMSSHGQTRHEKNESILMTNTETSESTSPTIPSTPSRMIQTSMEKCIEPKPTPPRVAQKHFSLHMVPTEAQLRWAQFHQKKRAALTQKRVQKLMQFPLHVDEVEGATSDDGDPFDDETSSCRCVQKNGGDSGPCGCMSKLNLSRGRRALLRVSARRTEQRKKFIQEHGFQMLPDDELEFNDLDALQSSSIPGQSRNAVEDSLAFDDISDALQVGDNSTTHEDSGAATLEKKSNSKVDCKSVPKQSEQKKKSGRRKTSNARYLKGTRSMALNADEDEERMRRFEEACSIMCSEKKDEQKVIKSNKRWTRGRNVPAAVSVDGRIYSDLQRSPTMKFMSSSKRYGTEVVGAELNGKKLTDRGATWMMHLPKKERRHSTNPYGISNTDNMIDDCSPQDNRTMMSPGKKKFMDIVDNIQARSLSAIALSRRFHLYQQNNSIMGIGETGGISSVESSGSKNNNVAVPHNNIVNSIGSSMQNLKDRISRSFKTDVDDGDYDGSIHTEESDPVYEQKIQIMAAQIKSSNSVIDTDNRSDISEVDDIHQQQARIGTLMMSPAVISKRLNQAISAVQLGQWDKVGYLILANPWLAEMTDVNSDQYLLHKLAYYGGGTISDSDEVYDAAPKKLNADFIKASSTAVCKFDSFGNLPLHRAAEAGNIDMAIRLLKVFPGGASVRNNDGQLPLHLAILACTNQFVKSPISLVSNILSHFLPGLAIADNDGNLPLHLVAAYVSGDLGTRLVHLLLDEAEKHHSKLRFPRSIKRLHSTDDILLDDVSIVDDENEADGETMLSVKNALGWNVVVTAIHMATGFEVLDALLNRPEAESLSSERDQNGQTILHMSMSLRDCEPSSIISIVKSFPDLVTICDENGALPIEIACMRDLPAEVIVAIALLDLPIDLDDDDVISRDGFGGSWWYLNCECDDNYVHVVREILGICDDYKQKRALCFFKDRQGNTIMTRATPKCKQELRKTLRFHGRFEFLGRLPTADNDEKEFEALDFGTNDEPRDVGRPVIIKYFENEIAFKRKARLLRYMPSNKNLFAGIEFLEKDTRNDSNEHVIERCIIIDCPMLTLDNIASSMIKQNYRNDHDRFDAYLDKIQKVFKKFAHSISVLHRHNIIHGNLRLSSCGKFEDGWKLTDLVGAETKDNPMTTIHMDVSAPPETVTCTASCGDNMKLLETYPACPAIDIWAFGKLLYEVLVGKPLIPREAGKGTGQDKIFLNTLGNWDEENLMEVVANIEGTGNGTLAADLISHCLCRRPECRPQSMEDVLSHPYWSVSPSQRKNAIGSVNRKYDSSKKRRFLA